MILGGGIQESNISWGHKELDMTEQVNWTENMIWAMFWKL